VYHRCVLEPHLFSLFITCGLAGARVLRGAARASVSVPRHRHIEMCVICDIIRVC